MTRYVEPEWAMVTILFADIRGFTTYADRSTAREAVRYLNEFFDLVVPLVRGNGGSVNKLLGDGLLGVFGAPDPQPDHADRAVAAGQAMLRAVEAELGDRCRIGIGINSGLVLVGTIGGGGHSEVGVIGDPVNVAARVQDATRDLGQPLLVTEATRCLVEAAAPALEAQGEVRLKGKPQPVGLHRLSSRNASQTPAA